MRHVIQIVLCLIFLSGCNNEKPAPKANTMLIKRSARTIETVEEVKPFNEFNPFWDYYSRNIKLNEEFLGYDKEHKPISKQQFLKLLATGKYQPLVINPTNTIRYQLKLSPVGADRFIAEYMKKFANEQLLFYGMEGHTLPKFNLKTIEGVNYSSENTKGKIILLKCWFITCVPCVQEMPELNDLVARYKNRKDIIFLSLAIDEEKPLKDFLKRTRFDYQTVAGQKQYMAEKLNVSAYPTHILVNKKGQVVKVCNDVESLMHFFDSMLKEPQSM
jgi:peroxiredoxin